MSATVKVDDLDGYLLSYYVAKSAGRTVEVRPALNAANAFECFIRHSVRTDKWALYAPHYRWKDAGPIMDRSGRFVLGGSKPGAPRSEAFYAEYYYDDKPDDPISATAHRPTVALCRCVVRVKFGDEVPAEIDPKDLNTNPLARSL